MDIIEGQDIFADDFRRQEQLLKEAQLPSDIQKFFEGSTIFITGGTGFLGKILIEKLLRTCWRLKRIYLLLRPKKGKSVIERFEEQFEGPLFDRLRKEHPNFKEKVTLIPGDLADDGAILSKEHEQLLIQTVDVIFHCAATVRFDERLRRAVNINIKATKYFMDIAYEMKNLKAFLHVSTAYSNCPSKVIGEEFYQPPFDYKRITGLLDILDDNLLDKLTPDLLGQWPNTYAFTKIIGEYLIKEYGKGLPIGVLRPSIGLWDNRIEIITGERSSYFGGSGKMKIRLHGNIKGGIERAVSCLSHSCYGRPRGCFSPGHSDNLLESKTLISTFKEPISGWINNYYGPQGVVVGAALGLLRTLHCNPKVVADLVPVDLVICALIALAWDIGQTRGDNPNFERVSWKDGSFDDASGSDKSEGSDEVPILNYVSSERNPITWGEFMDYNYEAGKQTYSPLQMWHSSITLNANYNVDKTYRIFCHYLPALVVDTIAILIRKKPLLFGAYKKIHKFAKVISYFCTAQWKFKEDNLIKLWNKMSEKDQQLFNFNIEELDWEQYFVMYLKGLRVYLIKDEITTLPEGFKRAKRLKIMHYSLVAVVNLFLLFILWWLYSLIFK